MVKIWEVILLPPWIQSQSQLSQTREEPKKTAAVWHNRSEADDGIQSCSWSINWCPWLINNWHLILIWWCTFTLSLSFNSSVMSFQHAWCFGDSYFRSSLLNPPSLWCRNAVCWEELYVHHQFCVSGSVFCMLCCILTRECSAAPLNSLLTR